jgi:WD40-like Beta Propeller Repeat
MPNPQTAPYGSWSSPITSDLIVASSIGLRTILLDGTDVYWIEARPQERGRNVIVRRAADGTMSDVTPPVPMEGNRFFDVRTSVHEYGGGAYCVVGGVVYFCNGADQRLYRQEEPGSTPVAITADASRSRGLRYADGVMDARRGRMIWVREDHTTAAPEPINTLVEIPLDGSGLQRVLQSGSDFYAAPRLSSDGRRLAWLEWNHPHMPWIGCELWVGEFAADGSIVSKRLVAGGDDESIFQPEWSPDDTLYFVSDRAQASRDGRWWNLFRARGDALDATTSLEPVYPLAAEFGRAQWQFRMSTFAFPSNGQLVCSYEQNGVSQLASVDLTTLQTSPIATEFQEISSVRASGART